MREIPTIGNASTRILVEPARVESLLPLVAPEGLPTRRDLLLQALLHLPRLALADGTIEISAAVAEIKRLHANRAKELAPVRHLGSAPTVRPSLDQLDVRVVNADEAEPILAHFHYLRSFREDSLNVAALFENRIVALCSVSPFDLPAIARQLPIRSPHEAAVISRVFAFDWAPRNVISYLLARTEGSEAVNRKVRMLLTYLNPNMGFDGASYKAANWVQLGLEIGTRYAYIRQDYITDRRLSSLPPSLRDSVTYSRMPLLPLMVFGRFVDTELARASTQMPHFVVQREAQSDD